MGLALTVAVVFLAACRTVGSGRAGDLPLQGRWHTLAVGETLPQVAARYHVALEDLLELNAIAEPTRVESGTELFIPEAPLRAARAPTPPSLRPGAIAGGLAPARGSTPPPGPFAWPVIAPLSSPFGWRDGRPHEGVDLAAVDGTPVLAAADGVVVYAGEQLRGYGRLVVLQHAGDVATIYAHNEALLVREGDRVVRGQAIARSGHTGHVTAPHVHFEVRVGGRAVDPLPLLAPR